LTGAVLYLSQPFAQHALIAGALVAVSCGLIGPFVVTRGMAFAVHGTSELAFTGAAAGLLVDNNPIGGALIGALVVASVIGALGVRERERDSAIGVILAFAISCGFLSSMLCGFVLNRRFVFGDGRASLAAASWRYSALVLFNFGVGVGVVTLLVSHGWNYLLTRVLSSTFLVVCNFSLARWWVFAVPGDNAVAETQAATH